MKNTLSVLLLLSSMILSASRCHKIGDSGNAPVTPPVNPPASNDINWWLTKGDQSTLLQQQTGTLSFGTVTNINPFIEVDTTTRYQPIDGFGFTFTGGSAHVISGLNQADQDNLMQELFGKGDNSIGISVIRISIGASDLNKRVFTYDDMPAGQTDPTLANFSLAPDKDTGTRLIPLLKKALAINPDIKIIATPWTAPVWMKDNGNSVGGSLQSVNYQAYAQYFVQYIQQMKNEGIPVYAITPQNEPLNPANNPSMEMTAAEQANFIRNNLGPALQSAGISTKIIIYDHNCDKPDYPLSIFADAATAKFTDGAAFHLYAGDISAMGQVHDAYPSRNLYFTEQYTASNGNFGGDLKWHLKNVLIGSLRNWSRTVLEWNLANDPQYAPYTPGGCNSCKGALTIGSSVSRNVAYYIIAHASRFVPAGSVRVASDVFTTLPNVAFQTPSGKKVLIVENDGNGTALFNIKFNGKWASVSLDAGAVATYTW